MKVRLLIILSLILFSCDSGGDGTIECASGVYDCEGTCDGELVEDCLSVCDGTAQLDECGECNGNGIPEGECDCDGNVLDCADECGGLAEIDECGECSIDYVEGSGCDDEFTFALSGDVSDFLDGSGDIDQNSVGALDFKTAIADEIDANTDQIKIMDVQSVIRDGIEVSFIFIGIEGSGDEALSAEDLVADLMDVIVDAITEAVANGDFSGSFSLGDLEIESVTVGNLTDEDNCPYDVDQCGTCDDDNFNNCIQDCNGEWGGNAVEDCASECGGSAVVDECGVCNGDGSSCYCESGIYDDCGVCGGDGIADGACDCEGNIADCAGVCDGDAVEDCAGDCGGDAVVDECGVCNGDGIADAACDCDGNIEDCLGTCNGAAVEDCLGVCNGGAILDDCITAANCPYPNDTMISAKAIDYNYNNTEIEDEVSIELNNGLLFSFDGMTCTIDENNELTFTADWVTYNDCYDVYDCGDSGCKVFMFELDGASTGTSNALMDAAFATYYPSATAYTPPCSDDYIHMYDICVPDCAGKECGSDGCLGSCGSCSGGDSCQSGSCVDECSQCLESCAGLSGCCWGGGVGCLCNAQCP